ncbi:iron dicitrate transport regulator FecR [Dyadobacter luteus]|uniref:Iron dicitrate transport regulator FecR n=1 Tax=Dyadobacter luteus TaxID=2259619 RepID=A0A3D8Y6E1_9BACT|nr:FecR domain-containing protein [Dyadobacter luteus]REA58385.1 iron dicitrate transport regulator FecR [Dyadobacter luteus]
MKTSISKHTLFEYLSGRSNPLEKQLVMEWLSDANNTEIFYEWLLEYETNNAQFTADQDSAMQRLLKRMDDSGIESGVKQDDYVESAGIYYADERTPLLRRVLFIAASVLFVVSAGWFFRDPIMYKTYQTAYGQTTDIFLEDGSKVALNANSSLKVPRFGFSDEVREVYLKGEGEFIVSHTVDHKRFVVKTSEKFQVEVLGTQFSVFARPRGTKVALTSGSVRIDYDRDHHRSEVMMVPGDLAVLDQKGKVQIEKNRDTKALVSWKEQRYVFDGTSVDEIASMIEENFGKKVSASNPETGKRTITGNFQTKNADELLKTISEVLDLKVQSSGDSILLNTH